MMNCTVIADLLPLYIDACCSKESAELVRDHLAVCPRCQKLYESMTKEDTTPIAAPAQAPAKKLRPLRQWQAAILQSILLFLSFALITVGVALEAKTPEGPSNGIWALWLVVPATGFMLSLVNWYFVKLYKSRRRFWISSLLFTLLGILAAFLWTFFHYDYFVLFADCNTPSDILALIKIFLYLICGRGILLSVVLCALSGVLSNLYAKLLGKE